MVVRWGTSIVEKDNTIFKIVSGDIKDAPDSLVSSSKNVPNTNKFSISSNDKKRLIDHILISKKIESNLSNVRILNENISNNDNVAPNFFINNE